MAKAGQRKCMSCGEFFNPDHRSGERQRYCTYSAPPLAKRNAGASIKPAAMAISPLAGAGVAALGARCCRSRQ